MSRSLSDISDICWISSLHSSPVLASAWLSWKKCIYRALARSLLSELYYFPLLFVLLLLCRLLSALLIFLSATYIKLCILYEWIGVFFSKKYISTFHSVFKFCPWMPRFYKSLAKKLNIILFFLLRLRFSNQPLWGEYFREIKSEKWKNTTDFLRVQFRTYKNRIGFTLNLAVG